MNKVAALTFLYVGKEITEEQVTAIVEHMEFLGIVASIENVTVIYKDGKAIADAIIATECKELKTKDEPKQNEEIVAAISHVGKMFKEDLAIAKGSKNYAPFIVHVIQSATNDYTLQRSIDIIASSKIPSTLLKKYGLTDNAVLAIKSIKVVQLCTAYIKPTNGNASQEKKVITQM